MWQCSQYLHPIWTFNYFDARSENCQKKLVIFPNPLVVMFNSELVQFWISWNFHWTWLSSGIGQYNGERIFLVHFEPENIEWFKMQTRKCFLQECKKCFKIHLFYGHYIIPMKVRKTIQKDLRVPNLFTLTALQRHLGQRKISTFPPQKNEVIFSPQILSRFAFKSESMWR